MLTSYEASFPSSSAVRGEAGSLKTRTVPNTLKRDELEPKHLPQNTSGKENRKGPTEPSQLSLKVENLLSPGYLFLI